MRIYDVYYGQELQTSVCVHDDGRKTWEDSAEWQSFHCSEDDKTVIADTIERYPNAEYIEVKPRLLRVQLRREPAK